MVVVSYYFGEHRRGMLAWRTTSEGMEALGGFDPGPAPTPYLSLGVGNQLTLTQPTTVVSTDAYERTLCGWVHPDHIMEVGGVDMEVCILEVVQ